VFLIAKKGAPAGDLTLLTMEEAFASGVLRVTEKEGGGEVRELVVENSGDRPVFFQAGDTLIGGQQDRTIAKDTLVPPRSGKLPIGTFCVEPGRWSQRASSEHTASASPKTRTAAESDFRANDVPVATKEQRLAIQLSQDQGRVWEAGKNAIQALSPGNDSYVLASQDLKLREDMQSYLKNLEPLIEEKGRDNIVGMVYAINGKITSGEVYGTTGLLRKFWPKFIRRSVLEAIAKREAESTPAPAVGTSDVERFLRQTAQAPESKESSETGLERSVRKTAGAIRFDTRWGKVHLWTKLD
jgi:hypothetical protein